MKKFTAVDLFCGAGGVSEALKEKYKIVAAVELDPIISKTYSLNHGSTHLITKDITKISEEDWINFTKLNKGDLDLLVSTPPCQGFSKHSRTKTIENFDSRNELIYETIRVANIFEPNYIFFENVHNIINYKVFHRFIKKLSNIKKDGTKLDPSNPSYHLRYEVVNSSDFAVPQKRKRLILLGKKIENFPCKNAYVKVTKNAIPHVKNPLDLWPENIKAELLGEYLKKFNLPPLAAGEKDFNDNLHTSRNLSETNFTRIINTPPNGGSRSAWPKNLLLNCHKKPNVSFGDVYGRMSFYDYAPTITCGCISYSKGRFGHPTENRAISLREAALIQTFPISYKFTGNIEGQIYQGSKDKIAAQIGNAVPVKLAEIFIDEIFKNQKSRQY